MARLQILPALAAGLALIPLALAAGEPGREIQAPMAVVILAGLLSAPFLDMVVVPALSLRFGPRALERPIAEEVDRELGGEPPRLGGAALGALALAAALGIGAAGCASAAGPGAEPIARPPAAAGDAPRLASSAGAARAPAPSPLPPGPIDLATAERVALERHPALEARALERDAARERARQAGLLPNPRLGLASETNRFDDPFASGEHVAGVALPIPWSGRLGATERAAAWETERRAALLEAGRREVLAEVRAAFAAALAAEEGIAAAREVLAAGKGAAELVRKRIAAGDAREGDLLRAAVDESRAALELEAALIAREKALAALAGAIGDPDVRIDGVRGELRVPTATARPPLEAGLERHPRLRALDAALEGARAEKERLEAERLPDLTLGANYRRVEGERADAFDLGASIEVPIFDRRQGAIAEAEKLVRAAGAARRAELAILRRALDAALLDFERARGRALAFERDVVPKAEAAVAMAAAAYEAGATTVLDVLEARRTLAETRLARIEALREAADAWARIEALAGEGR